MADNKTLDRKAEAHGLLARGYRILSELGEDWKVSVEVGKGEAEEPQATPPTKVNRHRLPLDTPQALILQYGPPIVPGKNEGGLTWVNFPDTLTRLYSREGSVLKDRDGDGQPDHRCHKQVKPHYEAAIAEIHKTLGQEEFRKQGLHVFGGFWSYRKKTGGSNLSTHSWAVSLDTNPGENPWKVNKTSFSDEVFDIFEKHGILSAWRAWGHDAMHTQRALFSYVKRGSYYAENGYPEWIIDASTGKHAIPQVA